MDRALLRWICVIAGLVLAALWLIAVLAGTPSLDWVPPSATVAIALAVAL